ncbi:hypothetical protein ESY86_18085 [Subsaximicrobium wynnwilliamsii]|uniref:T9SS C-terminal target domain-containing protein n=1 Tax=Subsaximicrobium wynnwilliamsii TaxID=291179 RepID=A0A5C6ZDI4_9FLAO|nr:hypothetical protein [Subsaximicrobium wynnwilliamsii]TXD81420.1 hypothetical protein ESY87_18300 [Subsaximicrobium wynnwilliamsii]TXD87136.1 hypothetical protein ESY86_18085 [Subsaximicrobium wynnwilliamsii]TXE00690.1 hypothetical protein ESY88_18755 [Subsaximicrobium wynnwilliamsii]
MKKITQLSFLLLFAFVSVSAQQEKGIIGSSNWLRNWTEFSPNKTQYGEPTQILTGNISTDTKLNKKDVYLLLGNVFVTDSTQLTIEPGTVILGDYKTNGTLTISKGCKIIADGTETDPIIFTSNRNVKKEGDWGGLFILGDAPINKYGNGAAITYGMRPANPESITYGGQNVKANSGILNYVRIEFAGKRTKDFGFFDALTLAGVGSETQIENVMVSYCAGNSFNVIGGVTNLSKMVSFRSSSNDYKFNYGAQSNISNSLAIRSPYVSGVETARCMYVSSYDNKQDVDFSKKGTSVTARNLTLVNVSDNLASDIKVGLVKAALYISKDAAMDISKSVISGFNPAVVFDNAIVVNSENLDRLKFTEMYFNNCKGNIFIENNSNNEDLENWYGNRAFSNVYSKGDDAETFIDLQSTTSPDYRLRINKIIASNDLELDD